MAIPSFNQETVPIGLKGPRAAILLELKRGRRVTARDLGRELGLSMNAVRHHLK